MAAAVTVGKEMILATERHWPDCALNRIGIEFDAAIMQEARKAKLTPYSFVRPICALQPPNPACW